MADEKTPIPTPPWTHEKLGEELYLQLAREYGFGDMAQSADRPDLDLTPFWNKPPAPASRPKKELE